MTDMTVANTILAQLGGKRFLAMTGAKSLCGDKDALSFKLPSQGGKTRGVLIRLLPSDTYSMKLFEMRRLEIVRDETREGIYCDNLRDVFTSMTGLATSL